MIWKQHLNVPVTSWKSLDDITLSEIVPVPKTSILQNELDLIGVWAKTNNMTLNP